MRQNPYLFLKRYGDCAWNFPFDFLRVPKYFHHRPLRPHLSRQVTPDNATHCKSWLRRSKHPPNTLRHPLTGLPRVWRTPHKTRYILTFGATGSDSTTALGSWLTRPANAVTSPQVADATFHEPRTRNEQPAPRPDATDSLARDQFRRVCDLSNPRAIPADLSRPHGPTRPPPGPPRPAPHAASSNRRSPTPCQPGSSSRHTDPGSSVPTPPHPRRSDAPGMCYGRRPGRNRASSAPTRETD